MRAGVLSRGIGLRLGGLLASASMSLAAAGFAPEAAAPPEEQPSVLVVVGAPGEEQYGESFQNWARLWEKASGEAGARHVTIGLTESGATNDLELFQAALRQEPLQTSRELWIILIGHGTFDGKEAKFNLRGPDVSATDLANWLQPFQRPLAVINTTSSSAPFLNKLSAKGRVIITATRSGYEQNYARFGQYLSAAISDLKADLDKDGQVSLLEAFLMAAHDVAEFYKTDGRLATEHPLIDDNGDGLGTPPDWFRGVRAIKKPSEGASPDGLRAHQFHLVRSESERNLPPAWRTQRDRLELALEDIRQTKETTPTEEYYERLETVLLDLARLYESSELQPELSDPVK